MTSHLQDLLVERLKREEDKMPFETGELDEGNEIYKDRYGELICIGQDNLIKSKYTIYEWDAIKDTRITIVDSLTGAIIRETK